MSALPHVAVIGLGGTIASASGPERGAEVRVTTADLVDALPELAALATCEVVQLRMVPSGGLTLEDLLAVRTAAIDALDRGCRGVVVTQGTDTMEEASYLLDLVCDRPEPIVVTGAMRHGGLHGSDGPANLLAAVRVAVEPSCRDLGVVVVFDDEIHAARHVRKAHTTALSAFTSGDAGPLGSVVEDTVRLRMRPVGRVHVELPDAPNDAVVALVTVTFDDDGRLIAAVPGLGYDGLVIAGLGGGHVPAAAVPAVEDALARIPVVIASRTRSGETLRSTYAYAGSEIDLLARGVVPAGGLDPLHAVVLLRLLLVAGVDRRDLATCFDRAAVPEGRVTITRPGSGAARSGRVAARPPRSGGSPGRPRGR
jgi:L-asparaginase